MCLRFWTVDEFFPSVCIPSAGQTTSLLDNAGFFSAYFTKFGFVICGCDVCALYYSLPFLQPMYPTGA